MKAIISTILHVNGNHMWEELQKTSSLFYIASPILTFKTQDGSEPPSTWKIDKEYSFKLYAFHIVPLGKHKIIVKRKEKGSSLRLTLVYENAARP